MSIIIPLLAAALLVAVAVFINAVISAPEGVQSEAGFALERGFNGQLLPEGKRRLKSERGPLGGIPVATTAGN